MQMWRTNLEGRLCTKATHTLLTSSLQTPSLVDVEKGFSSSQPVNQRCQFQITVGLYSFWKIICTVPASEPKMPRRRYRSPNTSSVGCGLRAGRPSLMPATMVRPRASVAVATMMFMPRLRE
jgi:hypothetical protein